MESHTHKVKAKIKSKINIILLQKIQKLEDGEFKFSKIMHTLNSFYVEIKSENRVEGAVNFCYSKCRLDFSAVAVSVLKYRALFTAFDNKIGFRCTKSQLSLLNIPTFEEQHLLLCLMTNEFWFCVVDQNLSTQSKVIVIR